jgi:MoaA/NifB/PqqE/SkfB family radical SAM enzyme
MPFIGDLNTSPGAISAHVRGSTGGSLASSRLSAGMAMRSFGYIKEIGRTLRHELGALLPPPAGSKNSPPDFVCIGITDDCMLRCKMCHKWKEDIFIKNKAAPAVDDWKRGISSLRRIAGNSLQINFGGGEPLLKKEIFALVSFSRKNGFKTNIATNGYLINEEVARKIADSGLDSIIISLDSLNEDTHDYLRGRSGTWRQVMNALELLDKFCGGMYKGICCVMYQKNMDDVLALEAWVEKNAGLNSVYFMAAMQPNNTVPDSRWFEKEEFGMLWPHDVARACAVIDELIKIRKGNSKITNQICQLEAFGQYYRHPLRFVKSSPCNMDAALHFSSQGDIFLCYRWALLGNIKTDDVAAAWNSRRAQEARQDIAGCKDNCHFLLNCFFKEMYPFKIAA